MKMSLVWLAGALLALPLSAVWSGCDKSERRVERHESVQGRGDPTMMAAPDGSPNEVQRHSVSSETVTSDGERRVEKHETVVTEETTTIVVPDAP